MLLLCHFRTLENKLQRKMVTHSLIILIYLSKPNCYNQLLLFYLFFSKNELCIFHTIYIQSQNNRFTMLRYIIRLSQSRTLFNKQLGSFVSFATWFSFIILFEPDSSRNWFHRSENFTLLLLVS